MLKHREIPDGLPPIQQAILTIAQYPCRRCLQEKLFTDDQRGAFAELSLKQDCIALCWKARFEGVDDPIYPELKEGRISQDFYDLIWLEVSYWEALWGLCQLVAPLMLEDMIQYGGEVPDGFCSQFLFRALVMEATNPHIKASFGYVEVPAQLIQKALKLKAKAWNGELTPAEEKRIQKLTCRLPFFTPLALKWLLLTVSKAPRNKAVQGQFEMFATASASLCTKKATVAYKNGCWGWNNGVLLKGQSNSTYAPARSFS
jgi:hypothetical protein